MWDYQKEIDDLVALGIQQDKKEIARLLAENERLGRDLRMSHQAVEDMKKIASHASGESAKLRAEVEALRKDAERYRWLRECDYLEGDAFSSINEWIWGSGDFSEITEAIDAAMKGA
ncbi:hypothetical protein D3C85_274390 [compost metagenome]